MKEIQIFINNADKNELKHEYTVSANTQEDIYTLHYSHDGDWSEYIRGKKTAKIKDTGDEVLVKIKGREETLVFDYIEVQQLLILLSMVNDAKISFNKMETVLSIEPIQTEKL